LGDLYFVKKFLRTGLLILLAASSAKAQLSFSSPDSLFAYAERNSAVAKINVQQSLLAKWTRIAALGNTVNFRNPVSFTATDNLMLPVNFIPASAFGGPPNTFREITLGQQYVSNFNFSPQIDIINPYAWAKVKSASVNKELTKTNVLLSRKNLYESITAAYYNMVSLQEQVGIMEQNLAAADSLAAISKNKYALGLVRQQDLNNSVVMQLGIKDKLAQLKAGLLQQENSLKILCDIPAKTKITVAPPPAYEKTEYSPQLKATSDLYFKSSLLQSEFARSELRAGRWSTLPVVSAVYYQGWQNNSNDRFFDSKQPWIQSQYIGLRLTVPIPSDVTRLSQNYTSKVNFRIAALNAEHAQKQNDLNNQNLELEYEKSYSALITAKQVYELKNSNYAKSLEQYREGILPADLMFAAFTDMLNARINFVSAHAALEYAKTKININNLVK